MIGLVARFELGQRLRRLSTWIYFGLFLALAFILFIASAGAFQSVSVGFGGGKVTVNSPHTLATQIRSISLFALLVVAALAGQAVNQDFQHRTYSFLFTAPVSKAAYLGGRLLGSLGVLALIHAAAPLGCFLGSLMPFVDQRLLGPNRALSYVAPYVTMVLPTLVVLGVIFFAIGTLTRKMRAVYVTAVVLLLGYILAGSLSSKIDNKLLAGLVDPFGASAFRTLTEYWSVAEKNSRLVPLSGVLLANRLVWLGIAGLVLGFTFRRFRLAEPLEGGRTRAAAPVVDEGPLLAAAAPPVGSTGPAPSRPAPLALLPRLTWLALRETVQSVGFAVITLAGVLFVVISARLRGAIFGTETYPVTGSLIELGGGSFALFVLIIITVYAGEIVHREREARIDQILDALPVPGWLPFAAKLGALLGAVLLLQVVVMLCCIGIQVAQGYYRFELGLYVVDLLGLKMVGYIHVVVLALFLQVLIGHKQLGQFAMVGYYIAGIALPLLGFEHNLLLYGGGPLLVHSDMNGYGHFLGPWAWFALHWSLAALVLVILTALLWPRGQETSLRQRARLAVARAHPALRLTLGGLALGFLATGTFIFYNTNVLNRYRTADDTRRAQVDYETRHKRKEAEPQPRITAVTVHFDLWPSTHVLRVRGHYDLVNRTDKPVTNVHVNLPDEVKIDKLVVAGQDRPSAADDSKLLTFTLKDPLAPGASSRAEFDLEYAPRGFKNSGASGVVMDNGTFVNSGLLPLLGYQPGRELDDDDDRRKFGLPPRPRMADLDDPAGRGRTYISRDADWIRFAASVCTSPDQISIMPGYLGRQWDERDAAGQPRRCSQFTSPSPILNFYSVLSARYAVWKDRWKPESGGDEVAIEILHQPGHEYNVVRMGQAVKASLAYFTKNFSPYQHRQVRIVEFPRYAAFAQSFPNTIPYSEAVGFIAKVDPDDEDDVDFPYYVTAHEVAHQWFAHQLIGADVQGATLLSESLSQYAALMVMKATYGEAHMKRFLRHELDRYLRGRAVERKRELPLVRVEDQAYIHYYKASLVFYALADLAGEAVVNRAIAGLLAKHAFKGPPYPRSVDLVAALAAEIPGQKELLADLFERITLFENRALAARATPLPGGTDWEVTLSLSAKKLRADELGAETEVPYAEPVELGVLGEDDRPLLLERRTLGAGEHTVKLRVAGKPKRAGVDPMNKLIDRKPGDNLVSIELP